MKIELQKITIRDLVEGYVDSQEEGVIGYGGKLNIRPKYQREFIYKDAQRNAVIDTVKKKFPLNIMYWVKNKEDYEVLDGQQRTISICEYVAGNFSVDNLYFYNLTQDKQEEILDYKIMIYLCEGKDSEKLEWFKTINIRGEELMEQELRNAIYSGPWLTDAKRHFSKTKCSAYQIGEKYINGIPIRQKYLETAIKWISKDNIEEYMSKNQNEPSCNELWNYFQSVINWVESNFRTYRKEMKGLDWGTLYNQYKNDKLDPNKNEEEISKLMKDDDVTKKKGIYQYILTRNEKYLNIRTFTDSQKRKKYEEQDGVCPICKKKFEIKQMEADHIKPWHEGGKTELSNCQMLCKEDNRSKSGK